MKKILSALVFLCLFSSAHATDPYTEELYGLYCKSCHGVKGSGAPQAFSKDWNSYLKLGMETLVHNAINGIRNMPAMGTCTECGPDELKDLISYMSTQEK
ncbi:MAG: hypothetical protein RL217_2088 [Pseudomonadota bacterium]|jgi:cytochrome c5